MLDTINVFKKLKKKPTTTIDVRISEVTISIVTTTTHKYLAMYFTILIFGLLTVWFSQTLEIPVVVANTDPIICLPVIMHVL